MYLAIDVETSYNEGEAAKPWVEGAYLSTVALVTNEGEEKCWVFVHDECEDHRPDKEKFAEIQAYIDRANKIILHNAVFDLTWLTHYGIIIDRVSVWDTAIVEYLLSGQTELFPALDSLAEKYLNAKKLDEVAEYWKKGVPTRRIPIGILCSYNINDCKLTLGIAENQRTVLQGTSLANGRLVHLKGEECKCVVEIESHGLCLDLNVRQRLEEQYASRLIELETDINGICGRRVNHNSPTMLSAILYGGNYPVEARCYYERVLKNGERKLYSRRESIQKGCRGIGFAPLPNTEGAKPGQYSTDKGILAQLYPQAKTPEQKKLLDCLLERSAIQQMLKTYIVAVADKHHDGVVHCNINQTATHTGRFSSSSPNLQNVPREGTAPVKEMFIPRFGAFVEGDAKALEWIIAAFLSQCPVMMEEIRNGYDPHSAVRKEVFNDEVERVIAKVYNFRQIYGGSPYSFYADPKMPNYSLAKWEKIGKKFYEKYYGLASWHSWLMKEVYRNKGMVVNPTGRFFKFQRFRTRNGDEYRKPQVVNYPVQSLATGDIIPVAMVELRRKIQKLVPSARMCNQVHDSIMYDCHPEDVPTIAHTMMEVFTGLPELIRKWFGFEFNLPMSGEIKWSTTNWKEMKVFEG